MTNNNSRLFTLAKYRQGGSNRYECPQCHRRRCFVRYIDINSGEELHPACGRCNHENSCGYHYTPKQLFNDYPDIKRRWLYNDDSATKGCVATPKWQNYTIVNQTQLRQQTEQEEFFDTEWIIKAAKRRPATLETFLYDTFANKCNVTADTIDRVKAEYLIGSTGGDIRFHGDNYGPAVIFPLIDERGRLHDAKIMAYRTDGHRSGYVSWLRAKCWKFREMHPEATDVPKLEWTEKVLFGQHLLTIHPDMPVRIVESEKTAIVCACKMPSFLWLATGGCHFLKPESMKPLTGRKVELVPDSGKYNEWKEIAAKSGHPDCTVSNFMEQYEDNTDLADVLLNEAKKKV